MSGVVQNQPFNKFGGGTLQFAGGANNTFGAGGIVWQGVLELNKTAAINAIPNAITIGDYVGTPGADVVRLIQANQIVDTLALTLNPTGLLDLNNVSESFLPTAATNSLTLNIGPLSSSMVTTGTGTLTLGSSGAVASNVVVNQGLPGGAPTPVSISGNVVISAGAAQTITVNDGTGIQDLVMPATLTGAQAVTKAGSGRMVLSGSNAGAGAGTRQGTTVSSSSMYWSAWVSKE